MESQCFICSTCKNDTDGDLGFHGLIDGNDWIHLEIDNPDGIEIFDLKLDRQLKQQTLTELFFESTEPNFDDLDPAVFFQRFPEGQYQVEAKMDSGGELSGDTTLTHLLPAPPANITANGLPVAVGCEGSIPTVSEPVTIAWDPVTMSHPSLGRVGEPVALLNYELIVEVEDVDFAIHTYTIQPSQTQLLLSDLPHQSGDLFKLEVLAREDSGNQTAAETCFRVN